MATPKFPNVRVTINPDMNLTARVGGSLRDAGEREAASRFHKEAMPVLKNHAALLSLAREWVTIEEETND